MASEITRSRLLSLSVKLLSSLTTGDELAKGGGAASLLT